MKIEHKPNFELKKYTPYLTLLGELWVFKSPRYTGVTVCFCTGSYAAAAAGRRFCSRDDFWTTFGISFIFGTIVGPDR